MNEFTHGYAVVVGVGADLPVTVDDAKAVASTLYDPGRCAYPRSQVQLLTDEHARRALILDALSKLAAQTQDDPDATVIVFFSGHGGETPDYFLVPFGYSPADKDGTAISGVEFTAKLRAIQARKLLIVLDCCHAGGIAEAKGEMFIKSPAPPGLSDALTAGSGRVVIASSRKDELSWTGKPYSVFTTALLEGLAGYGAFEQDGYARVLDITLWLGRMVPNRTSDKQHPIIKVSNLEDNFALAYYAGGKGQPNELDWAPEVPRIALELDKQQINHWRKMLREYQHNLRVLEEAISRFVMFSDVPPQYTKEKGRIEAEIAQLERKLGLR